MASVNGPAVHRTDAYTGAAVPIAAHLRVRCGDFVIRLRERTWQAFSEEQR
jgi:hypothetical protein